MEPDSAKELETEIELLKRIGQGDRRSFEELYDRFAGVLFSTAYRMLKNQSRRGCAARCPYSNLEKGAAIQSRPRQANDLGGNAHA
jgi:hypothetical protein